MRFQPHHVRTRLTLWYVLVLGSVLVLYMAGTCTFLFWNLRGELDRTLADDIETVEGLLNFGPNAKLRVGSGYRDEFDPEADQERLMEVRSLDGQVLYRSEGLGAYALGGTPFAGEGKGGYSQRSLTMPDGERLRVASRLHQVADRTVLIRLARSQEPFWREFRELLSVLLLGLPLALAVAGLGGYAMARRALKPLDTMARRAEQITADRLHERLPVENSCDELGHLAQVFNTTLARLERSFEQLRRFTADASHELRTPLTAIRSVGEVGLQKVVSATQYRDIIGSMLEEANRLTHLVDNLLVISRADSGHIQLRRAEVPLLELARESAGLMEVLAEEKAQVLEVSGDPAVVASADRLILRQALVNLIDNGIKYSPVGGRIQVRVEDGVLEVIDSGPGIPPEHQAKVFERFYRIDKARSRDAGGAGLGLSIAQWAVQAHGGTLELESQEGRGCTFRIRLPHTQGGEYEQANHSVLGAGLRSGRAGNSG